MASLLERLNIPATGAIRSKAKSIRGAAAPYNRAQRTPKGDVDSQWSHDLYESHNSLSARLSANSLAPKAALNNIAQRAIKEATNATRATSLSIKGANNAQGNVVEVTGLVSGTTAEDVATIFKRCGVITDQKLVSRNNEDVRIRLTFKNPAAAAAAVQKFNNQSADGRVLSVKVISNASMGMSLEGRLGGIDNLSLARETGSVDVLMNTDEMESGSKMRSDSLIKADPRAQVLVAPPGADPADYLPSDSNLRGGRRGRGGWRGAKRGRRGGRKMDTD